VRTLDVPPSSSEPKLQSKSLAAVKEWKFKPFLANGTPVFIDSTILFRYKGSEVTIEP
jgi:Gram-negative bacterial TonB protein C-terminal